MKLNQYRKRNFLTVNEFAESVRRSSLTIRRWIAMRKIESCKVGLGEYKEKGGKMFRRFHEDEKWQLVPRDMRRVLIPKEELERITHKVERLAFI